MKHVLVLLFVCMIVAVSVCAQQQQGIQSNSGTKGNAIAPRSAEQVLTTSGMPSKISYQGALTYVDSHGKTKAVKKGTYSVKFELFDDKTAGTLQDSHTYNVTVDKYGVYTVTLGEDGTDQGNLAMNIFDKLLWLKVTALSGPETKITYPYALTPRAQLTNVPYALGPWQKTTDGLSYKNGNVTVVHPNTNALVVDDGELGAGTIDATGFRGLGLQYDWIWGDGAIKASYPGGTGRLTFWTTATTMAERMRIDPWGNVGIGTTTPASRLDVNGDITVSGNVNYSTPKTGYVSGAGLASGRSLNDPGNWTYSGGGMYGGGGYEVPLNLPNGVTLSSVDVYGGDADATAQVQADVFRHTLSTGALGVYGSATSGVAFAGGPFTLNVPVGDVIDNSTYSYFLQIQAPNSNTVYVGYRATFTYSSPGALSTPVTQPAVKPVAVPQAVPVSVPSDGVIRLSNVGGR